MIGLGALGRLRSWQRGGSTARRWFLWAGVAHGAGGLRGGDRRLGRRPRSAASPSWSTACCAPPTPLSPVRAGAVAASLLAFMVIYAVVFSAGALYIPPPDGQGPDAGRATGAAGRAGDRAPATAAARRRPARGLPAGGLSHEPRPDPDLGRAHRRRRAALRRCWTASTCGVGILFPFARTPAERDEVMNAIAPVWDGNETWLVLGGGGLFAAFPLAYADHHAGALSADHPDAARRWSSAAWPSSSGCAPKRGHRPLWDAAFCDRLGGRGAGQGIMLGAILQGIRVENDAYAGGWLDWLSPFSVLTGLAVVIGLCCWVRPG